MCDLPIDSLNILELAKIDLDATSSFRAKVAFFKTAFFWTCTHTHTHTVLMVHSWSAPVQLVAITVPLLDDARHFAGIIWPANRTLFSPAVVSWKRVCVCVRSNVSCYQRYCWWWSKFSCFWRRNCSNFFFLLNSPCRPIINTSLHYNHFVSLWSDK